MSFTHDTRVALGALAALVNTQAGLSDSDDEELGGPEALVAFAEAHRYTGRVDGDHAEVERVRALRSRLLGFWDADEEAVVALVNALLREHGALPQIVRHDGFTWHVHAVEADRPLDERMAVEFALAVTDLLRDDDLGRLRRCDAQGCEAVLIDLSRNRSKRFCDTGNCANRTHVTAYRSRRDAGS